MAHLSTSPIMSATSPPPTLGSAVHVDATKETAILSSAKRHANSGKKNARKRRREAKKAAESKDALDYGMKRSAGRKLVNNADQIQTSARLEGMPVAAGAYVAKKAEDHEIQAEHVSIDELRSSGDWKYIQHEAMYVSICIGSTITFSLELTALVL